jgi:hypothetical protein
MSTIRTIKSIKSEADIIEFAELDFRGQRWSVLQAYYCNLFDLWEGESDLSDYASDKLAKQRWDVHDYASKRFPQPQYELDRDFFSESGHAWLAVHDGKALTGALFS